GRTRRREARRRRLRSLVQPAGLGVDRIKAGPNTSYTGNALLPGAAPGVRRHPDYTPAHAQSSRHSAAMSLSESGLFSPMRRPSAIARSEREHVEVEE